MTIAAIGDLEVIPRRQIEYRGVELEEMDLDAIIARDPDVVLVDEIAHTNAPGSKHEKRWQDVNELLEHGITVISTMNIQHLESLADIVERITGVAVRERVPDRVLDDADEVQLVDMTRTPCGSGSATATSTRRSAPSRRWRASSARATSPRCASSSCAASRATVEEDLEEYMRGHGLDAAWPAGEGVAVVVDALGGAATSCVAPGAAEALRAPLVAVWVEPPGWGGASPEERAALEEHLRLAEDLGAEVVRRAAATRSGRSSRSSATATSSRCT